MNDMTAWLDQVRKNEGRESGPLYILVTARRHLVLALLAAVSEDDSLLEQAISDEIDCINVIIKAAKGRSHG